MSERKQAVVDIHLDNVMSEFHFAFDGGGSEFGKTLEELLETASGYLRGRTWVVQQNVDLVVIGETDHHQYILNRLSSNAVQCLAEEYGGHELQEKNVCKSRLCRVIVRNALISGRDSIVLEAYVACVESAHGYCKLCPTYMNLSTRELDAVIDELMKLKMLKVRDYVGLRWLRKAYSRMPRC